MKRTEREEKGEARPRHQGGGKGQELYVCWRGELFGKKRERKGSIPDRGRKITAFPSDRGKREVSSSQERREFPSMGYHPFQQKDEGVREREKEDLGSLRISEAEEKRKRKEKASF